jgi:hypothetical protein
MRTSNRYWKDKLNIRTECDPSGTDCFFYQTKPGGAVKTMQWNTKAVEGETATFTSQGTGMLRFVGARWEVIGWSSDEQQNGATWMVVYQQSTILTPAAINVSCRRPKGISESDMKTIDGWLMGVEDEGFRKAVEGMFAIVHD